MKPRIRSTQELAKALGMSRWTVSRALNGHGGLSPKTIARVVSAAREYGFSPSILGRGLRQGRTKLIGICLPDLVDYFLTDKVASLQKAIEARGFHPLFQMNSGSAESEKSILEGFASMHCAGIVIIASRLEKKDPILRNFAADGIPLVRIDPLHEKPAGSVATDRSRAMQDVVHYLQEQGHRRIALFGIRNDTPFGRQRVEGLKIGLKKCGLSFSRDLSWFEAKDDSSDFSAGAEMARAWIDRKKKRETAIIALNDRVALGAMRALMNYGIKIPADLSIIGYDNADFSAHTDPPLSTIDPQVSGLINQSIAFLFPEEKTKRAAIADKANPVLVKPTLLIRDSSGKAPKALHRLK